MPEAFMESNTQYTDELLSMNASGIALDYHSLISMRGG